MGDEFEWDPRKERLNRLKHGVGFEEASTVFEDSNALSICDEAHSGDEDRYIIIGYSTAGRILVVSHTHRIDTVRIISARRATPRERRHYGESR